MRTTFHLKTLAVAIATLSVASMTNAAGLDRSGQDVTAFFFKTVLTLKPFIPISMLMLVAMIVPITTHSIIPMYAVTKRAILLSLMTFSVMV